MEKREQLYEGKAKKVFATDDNKLKAMEKIHGLIDAPFTPFYENGEVNYEPIEAYCQPVSYTHLDVYKRHE